MNTSVLFTGAACLVVLGYIYPDTPPHVSSGLVLMWIGLASL